MASGAGGAPYKQENKLFLGGLAWETNEEGEWPSNIPEDTPHEVVGGLSAWEPSWRPQWCFKNTMEIIKDFCSRGIMEDLGEVRRWLGGVAQLPTQ